MSNNILYVFKALPVKNTVEIKVPGVWIDRIVNAPDITDENLLNTLRRSNNLHGWQKTFNVVKLSKGTIIAKNKIPIFYLCTIENHENKIFAPVELYKKGILKTT